MHGKVAGEQPRPGPLPLRRRNFIRRHLSAHRTERARSAPIALSYPRKTGRLYQSKHDREGAAMSLPVDARLRLDHLIAGFLDGALSAAEEQEFAALLTDPEARQAYYAQSAVHVML